MDTPYESLIGSGRQEARDPPFANDLAWGAAAARPFLTRIAVKSVNRIVIVQVADIVRIEAEDNYVRLWAERPYLHKETLSGLVARLSPLDFLRVHRSHAINVQRVRELRPKLHDEYLIVLSDGTEVTSGRGFRAPIQHTFGLA